MKRNTLTWFMVGLLPLSLLSPPNASCAEKQDLEEMRQKLASPDYETRKSVVTELCDLGSQRPLNREEIDLLLPHLKSDSDWRIKVRITDVLGYAANPDWVVEPLIAALQDTDEKSSGSGNVPGYAAGALARLGDARAQKPLRGWLEYLDSHPVAYPHVRDVLIEQARKNVSELEKKIADRKRNGKPEESDGAKTHK